MDKIDIIMDTNEIRVIISDLFENYRRIHDLTQDQLANKLNVRDSTIRRIENGMHIPTLEDLYKYSIILTNSNELFIAILQKIQERLTELNKGREQTQWKKTTQKNQEY